MEEDSVERFAQQQEREVGQVGAGMKAVANTWYVPLVGGTVGELTRIDNEGQGTDSLHGIHENLGYLDESIYLWHSLYSAHGLCRTMSKG